MPVYCWVNTLARRARRRRRRRTACRCWPGRGGCSGSGPSTSRSRSRRRRRADPLGVGLDGAARVRRRRAPSVIVGESATARATDSRAVGGGRRGRRAGRRTSPARRRRRPARARPATWSSSTCRATERLRRGRTLADCGTGPANSTTTTVTGVTSAYESGLSDAGRTGALGTGGRMSQPTPWHRAPPSGTGPTTSTSR